MYEIIYQPRAEDPVVIGKFNTKEEAEAYMEEIKQKRPKAAPYHSIQEQPKEHGGPKGLEPTRYNTWETKGREIDF